MGFLRRGFLRSRAERRVRPMSMVRKRKCLNCKSLYEPDPRTRDRQRHCSDPACQKASKARRQRRWLAKKENRDYFRGPENSARVKAWRKRHPERKRKKPPKPPPVYQDDCPAQPVANTRVSSHLLQEVLQDDCASQPILLLGLISVLTNHVLQDDIAPVLRKMHARGSAILGNASGRPPQGTPHDPQAHPRPPPHPEGPRTVQLA